MACGALAAWLLARAPSIRPLPAPVLTLHVAATPLAMVEAEPLFAEPPIDGPAARRRSGPPQLMGIVGRVSAPLAIVRLEDGAFRTIAPGGRAGGWTLESVSADRVTFRRGGDSRVSVLPLRDPAQ